MNNNSENENYRFIVFVESHNVGYYSSMYDSKPHNRIDDIVEIENKEDMEEKKLNLKPFDIQKAREGKPVCTRDGRNARIICFDRESVASIVALIMDNNDREEIRSYYEDGKSARTQEYHYDLMMLPEKKEGWVNVYKGGLLGTRVYNTKKEAFDNASSSDYLDTVKIGWEE